MNLHQRTKTNTIAAWFDEIGERLEKLEAAAPPKIVDDAAAKLLNALDERVGHLEERRLDNRIMHLEARVPLNDHAASTRAVTDALERIEALEKVSSANGQHWLKIGGKSYNDIQSRLARLERDMWPLEQSNQQVDVQQAQMSMTQLAAQQNAHQQSIAGIKIISDPMHPRGYVTPVTEEQDEAIKARVQEDANAELLKAERERIAERFDKAGKTHDAAYIRAGAFGYPPQYRACATCGESLEKHPAYCGLDCASKGR